MDLEKCFEAVGVLIGNPFDPDIGSRRIEAAEILQERWGEVRDAVHAPGEELNPMEMAVLLALGSTLMEQNPRTYSEMSRAPEWRRLGVPVNEVLQRRLEQVGRCFRGVRKMAGTSDAVNGVRRSVWNAVFGPKGLLEPLPDAVIRAADVLVLGETGTGKELVASAVMDATPTAPADEGNADQTVNVNEFSEALLESELFGHVEGAYTGAVGSREGKIRRAGGHCLFMDELGEMPMPVQVKLLRVIQENKVSPVGSDDELDVDIRYVFATHRDLKERIAEGRFREDLYHRIAGLVIRVPPLRERQEDVVKIARHLLAKWFGAAVGHDWLKPWAEQPAVRGYGWPGNVRELERALRLQVFGLEWTPQAGPDPVRPGESLPSELVQGKFTERELKRWYAERMLEKFGGSYTRAAKALKVQPSTLYRRFKTAGGR